MLREGKPEDVGMSSARLERTFRLLSKWVEDRLVTGGVALVSHRGLIVAHRAFGNAAVEPEVRPMRLNSIFWLASITKVLTATCIMILLEKGKLELDDTVTSIIPKFRGNGKEKVRIRHLLTHTSGLPQTSLKPKEPMRPKNSEEIIQEDCRLKLDFNPGARVQYSNANFNLLGKIVEITSGADLPHFARENIFAPLRMHDTFFKPPKRVYNRMALVNLQKEMRSDTDWNSKWFRGLTLGSSCAYSTAKDMAVFCQMFLNGGEYGGSRVLSSKTVQLMTHNHTPSLKEKSLDGILRPTAWGLGWPLRGTRESFIGELLSPSAYAHAGAGGTLIFVDPKRELAGVFLTTMRLELDFSRLLNILANTVVAAVVKT